MGLHPTRWHDQAILYRVVAKQSDVVLRGSLNALVDIVLMFPDRWDPYLIVMDDGERFGWEAIAAMAVDPARPIVGRA